MMLSFRHHFCSYWIAAVIFIVGCGHLPTGCIYATAAAATTAREWEYALIAVSGGLQDGFPDRVYLDYVGRDGTEIKAVFVGHALVRGYKAFLDVKQVGWREYREEPDQPRVNPAVYPTGCPEHANVYAIYLLEATQALRALQSEPRYLSMTPDAGLVDLNAEETSPAVRALALAQAARQGMSNTDFAAFLTVTSVWYNADAFVASPPIYTKEDGTQVTDYPHSLAKWAKTDDAKRSSNDPAEQEEYWNAIRLAIRAAEQAHPQLSEDKGRISMLLDKEGIPMEKTTTTVHTMLPKGLTCQQSQPLVRFGTDKKTARLNDIMTACEVKELATEVGIELPVIGCEKDTRERRSASASAGEEL